MLRSCELDNKKCLKCFFWLEWSMTNSVKTSKGSLRSLADEVVREWIINKSYQSRNKTRRSFFSSLGEASSLAPAHPRPAGRPCRRAKRPRWPAEPAALAKARWRLSPKRFSPNPRAPPSNPCKRDPRYPWKRLRLRRQRHWRPAFPLRAAAAAAAPPLVSLHQKTAPSWPELKRLRHQSQM